MQFNTTNIDDLYLFHIPTFDASQWAESRPTNPSARSFAKKGCIDVTRTFKQE